VGSLLRNAETGGNSSETVEWNCKEAENGWVSIFSLHDLPDLLARVLRVMKQADYGAADSFAVRLALEEAAVNAVKHGHGHDPQKQVGIWWTVTPTSVRLVVEDEGPGFDPATIADPSLPENLGRPRGRGLFLIFAYMTWVRFNRRGNCLVMYRHRSQERAPFTQARSLN
jgi:serine/threonine-protein kinase RsbW